MTKAAKDQREKSVKVGSRGLLFSVSYGGCSDYAGKSFFCFLRAIECWITHASFVI